MRSPLGLAIDPKDVIQEVKIDKQTGPNEALPIGQQTKSAYLNLPGSSDAESAAGKSMQLDRITYHDVPVPGICGKSIYDSRRIIHFHNCCNSIPGLKIDDPTSSRYRVARGLGDKAMLEKLMSKKWV